MITAIISCLLSCFFITWFIGKDKNYGSWVKWYLLFSYLFLAFFNYLLYYVITSVDLLSEIKCNMLLQYIEHLK